MTSKKLVTRVFWGILSAGIFLIGAVTIIVLAPSNQPAPKLSLKKAFASINAIATPVFTPTPTPTPTPVATPTPTYAGYCLDVPVLYYHHTAPQAIAQEHNFTSLNVDAGLFDEQMAYIASHGYTTIFASDLAHALQTHSPLPPKSIVVTLDDGYDDVYSYAFQSAQKYHVKLSLFVPTGLLGITSSTNSYYTWEQLQQMVISGLAQADNHTWSHYPMGTKAPTQDVYEMQTAENQLQQHLGFHSTVFAYPYGTNQLSGFVQGEVKQQGFAGAFSTIGGQTQCDTFLYALHRTRIGNIPFPAYGIY